MVENKLLSNCKLIFNESFESIELKNCTSEYFAIILHVTSTNSSSEKKNWFGLCWIESFYLSITI